MEQTLYFHKGDNSELNETQTFLLFTVISYLSKHYSPATEDYLESLGFSHPVGVNSHLSLLTF